MIIIIKGKLQPIFFRVFPNFTNTSRNDPLTFQMYGDKHFFIFF